MGNVSSRRFVVGIDLGTSNTVVAFAANANDKPAVEPIAQRVTPTTIDRLPLLPSCLYAGLPDEIAPDTELDETDGWVLGEIARRRGAEVPSRLVSSSKSWLCHPRVDKEAAILPWGSDDEDVPKLSPVEAIIAMRHSRPRTWC
jgi:molecular chaperone DnaK (HSP70)